MQKLSYNMKNVFALQKIEKACFGKDAWSINNLRSEFENPYSHFFAEERDGQLVGYVCVRTMYEEGQVCNVAVLPEYCRQGIATQLVQAMLTFSSEHGCTRCELEVNVQNAPAIGLYKKCGFEVVGVRKNFYRRSRYETRDAYTMVLEFAKTEDNAQ